MTRTALILVALTLLTSTAGAAPAPTVNVGLGEPPSQVDRSSLNTTVANFLSEAHAGHYGVAAHYLNLSGLVPDAEQPTRGAKLARRLRFVLDRQPWMEGSDLHREQESVDGPRASEEIGQVTVGKLSIPIVLGKLQTPEGAIWLFSRGTVRSIDRMYDAYGPPWGERLPDVVFNRILHGLEVWQWLGLWGAALGALVLALLLERVILALARRVTRLTSFQWDDQLVVASKGPLSLMIGSAAFAAVTPSLQLPSSARSVVGYICKSLLILACAWLARRFVRLASELLERAVLSSSDSASVRGVRTQVAVLKRVASAAVYVVAAAVFLLQFPVVQTVGVSLLASAGVAGLVIGLAAQKSIGTLLAGIQLSITQPIRIGDSVVVEGETGTIEEINLTYVVVRVWDLRRLIIPITYFLDKPFQNWSKGAHDLLGTVTLAVDYTADVNAFREEVKRILQGEGRRLWDGRKGTVAVTEASDRTQTLRVLLSAQSADDSWDLRCLVRERLIEFLRRHPGWLPTQRTQALPQAQHVTPPPVGDGSQGPAPTHT